VAVVLALASPAVAIGAAWLGVHQQRMTLRHERQRDDLSEVRRVLDDASRALHVANRAWRKLLGDPDTGRMKEEFREAVRAVEEVGQRVAIRFGREHPVTKAFDECVDGMPDALDALDRVNERGRQGVSEADRQRILEAGQKLKVALPVFIEKAKSYAGVELPPTTKSPRDGVGSTEP
jgi:hypothetical protein